MHVIRAAQHLPFLSKWCVNEIAAVLVGWTLSARTSIILPLRCRFSPSRSFKRMLNTQRFYGKSVNIYLLHKYCHCTEGFKCWLEKNAIYFIYKDKDSEKV